MRQEYANNNKYYEEERFIQFNVFQTTTTNIYIYHEGYKIFTAVSLAISQAMECVAYHHRLQMYLNTLIRRKSNSGDR